MNPQTILVVGMHRSGTSLLARMINLMGAVIGRSDDLLPAHPHNNPAGYWERTDIVIEHERFLQQQGQGWATIANFRLENVSADRKAMLIANLRAIVSTMACDDAALVVKDPRLCLLLPLWCDVAGLPVHVVVVRDPRKIAASLMAAYPKLFTTDFVLALWQKYMQSALAGLRAKRVIFVSYAQMMANPLHEHRRLWDGLNALGARSLRLLDDTTLHGLLDGRLDRSEPSSHARLTEGQAALFDWLNLQCASEGPVSVTNPPTIHPADPILLELETLRQTYLRKGAQMAQRDNSSLARIQATTS